MNFVFSTYFFSLRTDYNQKLSEEEENGFIPTWEREYRLKAITEELMMDKYNTLGNSKEIDQNVYVIFCMIKIKVLKFSSKIPFQVATTKVCLVVSSTCRRFCCAKNDVDISISTSFGCSCKALLGTYLITLCMNNRIIKNSSLLS